MNAIIVFIKNPELGKVKTRLAATIGDDSALKVYKFLMEHTRHIAEALTVDRFLYYAFYINYQDDWSIDNFQKYLQHESNDLGQKMYSAFIELKAKGYKKAIIMGSDCYENSSDLMQKAFEKLEGHQVVIGPALDGGYYALGFNFNLLHDNDILEKTFLNKSWSHEFVYNEAMEVFQNAKLNVYILPTLSDVDVEADIETFKNIIF